MDNKEIQNFLQAAESVSLHGEERESVRSELQAFMHDVRAPETDRLQSRMEQETIDRLARVAREVSLTEEEKTSTLAFLLAKRGGDAEDENASSLPWFLAFRTLPAVAVFFLAVLIVGSGLSLAASDSLPGDFLYPVKIHLTEPLQGLGASDETRVRLDAERAGRRLSEAETLAAKKQLDLETTMAITDKFNEHLDDVEETLTTMSENGQEETAVELHEHIEAWLTAHESVLTRIAEQTPEEANAELQELLKNVRSASKEATAAREQAEVQMSQKYVDALQDVAEKTLRTAMMKTHDVELTLAGVSSAVNPEIATEADAKIMIANNAIEQARSALKEGKYVEARTLARQALHAAEEASLLLQVPVVEEDADASSSAQSSNAVEGEESSDIDIILNPFKQQSSSSSTQSAASVQNGENVMQ